MLRHASAEVGAAPGVATEVEQVEGGGAEEEEELLEGGGGAAGAAGAAGELNIG